MNIDMIDEKDYSKVAFKNIKQIRNINKKLESMYVQAKADNLKRVQISQELRDEAVALYFSAGFEIAEFSRLFHAHHSTVRKWITRLGNNAKFSKNNEQKHEEKAVNKLDSKTIFSKSCSSNEGSDSEVDIENLSFATLTVVNNSSDSNECDAVLTNNKESEITSVASSHKPPFIEANRSFVNRRHCYSEKCDSIEITYPNKITVRLSGSMCSRDLLHDLYFLHLPDD